MERRDRASATTSESQLGLDLTHTCCIWEHTEHNGRFQAWGRLDWTQRTSKHFPASVPVLRQAGARVRGGPIRAHFYATCGVLQTLKPSEKLFFCVCSHFSRSCWPLQRGVSLCRSKPRFISVSSKVHCHTQASGGAVGRSGGR